VENIITSPPQQDRYTKLRTERVNRLFPSREKRIRWHLTFEEMDDRNTSKFLRRLRNLAPDVPDDFCTTADATGQTP
jgi:hypothetical protein